MAGVFGPSKKKSLNAATATGAGAELALNEVKANHGLQVVLGGTVNATTVVVSCDVSLDGVNWTSAGTWSLAGGQTSGQTVWFTGKPASHVRANLTSFSGGTAPTCTAFVASA